MRSGIYIRRCAFVFKCQWWNRTAPKAVESLKKKKKRKNLLNTRFITFTTCLKNKVLQSVYFLFFYSKLLINLIPIWISGLMNINVRHDMARGARSPLRFKFYFFDEKHTGFRVDYFWTCQKKKKTRIKRKITYRKKQKKCVNYQEKEKSGFNIVFCKISFLPVDAPWTTRETGSMK